VDSLEASVVLGVNGVTLIADGTGRVDLNEDLIVNNVCHILRGPNFQTTDRLVISADEERAIRVRSGGKLDLSSFSTGYNIEFTGYVKIVLEPGAQLILGGGKVTISEYATIYCSPLIPSAVPSGTALTALDTVRVKIGGTGTMLFEDQARMIINKGAFVGIESIVCRDREGVIETITATNLTWILNDEAQILIGDGTYGGALQVGNAESLSSTVSFSLDIDGLDAGVVITSQGFLGLGVGIADKTNSLVTNWRVAPTNNLTSVYIAVENGKFVHNQIYEGDESAGRASLFAVGPSTNNAAVFNLLVRRVNDFITSNVSRSTVQGGGNFFFVDWNVGTVQPPDFTAYNIVSVSTLASKPLLRTETNPFKTAAGFFDFWQTKDLFTDPDQPRGRVDLGPGKRNRVRVGWVDNIAINRESWTNVIGQAGTTVAQGHSLEIGAVAVDLLDGPAGSRMLRNVWELN